jgi:hypothetical protein
VNMGDGGDFCTSSAQMIRFRRSCLRIVIAK